MLTFLKETGLSSSIAEAELGAAAHTAFFFLLCLSFPQAVMRNETEALLTFARRGGISEAAPPEDPGTVFSETAVAFVTLLVTRARSLCSVDGALIGCSQRL